MIERIVGRIRNLDVSSFIVQQRFCNLIVVLGVDIVGGKVLARFFGELLGVYEQCGIIGGDKQVAYKDRVAMYVVPSQVERPGYFVE